MRIGIIGTNFISDMLVEASRLVDGVTVSAVYSRSRQTGEAFASKHGGMDVYDSLDDLLSSDIDAVYIASPHFMHKPQALSALRTGKHVLCEKMMALRYADGLEMSRLANERGLVLMEAMRPIHDPAFGLIAENIHKIGRVRRAHFEYCQYSSRYDRFKRGEVLNAFDPTIGNSALADIGIYPLEMCLGLFGTPDGVKAESVFLENGFEGMGQISLGYGDMLATVTYSKITESIRPSVIEGEDGAITISRLNGLSTVMLYSKDGSITSLKSDPPRQNNMHHELAHFRDLVLLGATVSPYLDITLNSLKVVDEVYGITGIDTVFRV